MAALSDCSSLTLHYAYFIIASLIGSVIIYLTSAQIDDIHYADASFMSFSAMVGTGLNVVDLTELNVIQQGTLFTLFIFGHAIPIFGVLSFVRAWALFSILKDDQVESVKEKEQIKITALDIRVSELLDEREGGTFKKAQSPIITSTVVGSTETVCSLDTQDEISKVEGCTIITDLTDPNRIQRFAIDEEKGSSSEVKKASYLPAKLRKLMRKRTSWIQWRSSIDFSKPGGVECFALLFLSALIFIYFLAFLSFGIITLGLYLNFHHPEILRDEEISSFWAGAFLATSAFVNNGMSLVDASMVPFQRDATPLVICGILILAGNTLFPCLLRLAIWGFRKILPNRLEWQTWREALDYTLAQSQNICSALYPTWHTWFLFGSIVVINSIMWAAFEVASIQDSEIRWLPAGYRVLDGLFQSLSIRGVGFSVVSFDRLPQGLLILFVLMMYLSAFPVSAAIGTTESANEQPKDIESKPHPRTSTSSYPNEPPYPSRLARGRFLYQQVRSQFSHDIWWLSLTVLFIAIAESDHFKSDPIPFATFNIIFEVVSAYSCVGASIGYPDKTYAFCGRWHTFSKLLLVAVSLKGRLRGVSIAATKSASLLEEWKNGRKDTNKNLSSCV